MTEIRRYIRGSNTIFLTHATHERMHSATHDYIKNVYYDRNWGTVEMEGMFGE